MSNTSVATPYADYSYDYDSTGPSVAGDAIGTAAGAALSGGVSLATWLARSDERDAAVRQQHRTAARRSRLSSGAAPAPLSKAVQPIERVQAVQLRCNNVASLTRTAERLGYRLQRLPIEGTGAASERAPLLFERPTGERLAFIRTPQGLALQTAASPSLLREVVRQSVLDRTEEHFLRRGLAPKVSVRRDGAVEISVDEKPTGTPNPAQMTARVYDDGRVRLDIDCAGNKCEGLREAYLREVDLELAGERRKDTSFTLPGEPAKARVRV